HTPDNSFLGFVVEQHLNASDIRHMNDIKRQNQSLVYGKVDNFWKDKNKYLDIIHTYMEIHGTVHEKGTVHMPNYVKNHGILSGRDLQFLLRETTVSWSLLISSHKVISTIEANLLHGMVRFQYPVLC
ncbi:hypothetical protein GDO81_019891, partial [Engystomops pustulosus]